MLIDTSQTRGRWRSILPALGISESFLTGRKGPCPMCEGKDRFRFDDKHGEGMWFCTHCGAGDGYKLAMLKLGVDFRTAATEISKHINGSPVLPAPKERTPMQKREMLRRTWTASSCIGLTTPPGEYLHRRCGLTSFPPALRYAPKLAYRDETETSFHPAMLAQVKDAQGQPVNIHRTYLDESGRKAAVGDPRRTMEGQLPAGCAVRLTDVAPVMGVAEGIETALSCTRLFGVPTWSTLNAVMLTKWEPPEGCESVWVFADNDDSFVGQQAAYALAQRLHAKHYAVEVHLPANQGDDWNDVHQELMGAA